MKKDLKRKRALNRKMPGKGKLYLRLAVLFFIVLLAAGAYAYARFAREVLPISRIEVYGEKNMAGEEVLALLAVEKGENLFRHSSGEVAQRLLSSPWVKNASVRKELMNMKLLVRVEERQPFVIIRKEGKEFISDMEGRLLEELRGDVPPFLPVLEADWRGHPDTFKEAVVFARLLKERGYFEKPVTITAEGGPETLSMDLDGITVRVGYGDYEQKLEKLKELEAEIERRGIPAESIDLRFANRVVVSPLEEVAE